MRSLPRRLLTLPAMLMLLGAVVAVALVGGPAKAQAPAPAPPQPDVISNRPSGTGTAHGRALYLYSCATCHGQKGEGTYRGPTLIGVGEASVDFYLRTGRMPLDWEDVKAQAPRGKPAFNPSEIGDLDAYVGSLSSSSSPIPGGSSAPPAPAGVQGPSIPSVHPGDLATGRDLYLENCAACHSPSGIGYTQVGGRIAPSLLDDDPLATAEAIRVGPNLMPQFPESIFDSGELNSLVNYVQYLQRRQVGGQGGAQIGRIGAAVETLVGFAAVVLLVIIVRLLGKRSPEKRAS